MKAASSTIDEGCMLGFISDKTKFFIVAPANFATGGPELLHQLAFKLRQYGKNVSMYYLPVWRVNPVHKNYEQYDIGYVRRVDDDEHNILIFPEIYTDLLVNYKSAKKIIWWLSVDNYFLSFPGLKGRINNFLLNKFGSQRYLFFNKSLVETADFHLVQSEYARSVLYKNYIFNVYYLSDYLHGSFLAIRTDVRSKENFVAYNPKKGFKFTQKLIKKSPDIRFVAIVGMDRNEVISLLQKAKVYIDFGHHPGKDRIPREAALLRCCVITNRRGSAEFSQDIQIMDEFKFSEDINNISKIRSKIHECFDDFDISIAKFRAYQEQIKQQERDFEYQLERLLDLTGVNK